MSERPHVTVVYQDAKQPTGMGCAEMVLSALVLVGMGLLAGVIHWW